MYEWPDAYEMAVEIVLGRRHCGNSDCCGPITLAQRYAIVQLTANLCGFDYYAQI